MNVTKNFARSDYIKYVVAFVVVVLIVGCFFVGLGFALKVNVPLRVVESGSMCMPYGGSCDGGGHVFEPTLHVGDIIIIQGVDPKTLNTDYLNSDIIVYRRPTNPADTPIVHRIVASYEENGTLYFQTKGDGNGTPYPAPVNEAEYDSNNGVWAKGKIPWPVGRGVPEDLVEGKVVLRIPWLGHITLFMRGTSWGLPLVIVIIFILVVLEFILPVVKKKTQKQRTKTEYAVSVTVQSHGDF
jgi:signal peptidase I